MDIGLQLQANTLDELIAEAREAARLGLNSVWQGGAFPLDSLTALTVLGREIPDIKLGTAVVATYPRHPLVLAVQAQTVQAATGGRLLLGVGPSHQILIEDALGYSYAKPAQHVRDYLSALVPLLHTGVANHRGPGITAVMRSSVALPHPPPPVPILLSALAPMMLQIAGELADGTITFMAGPRAIAEHIVPSITAAATAADRPRPRVIAPIPMCVTSHIDNARERIAPDLNRYGQRPAYRAMLEREGADSPVDLAVIGDEDTLAELLAQLRDAGVTEVVGYVLGNLEERQRTKEALAAMLGGSATT